MRVSLNWLKELAPTTAGIDELAEKLTAAGLEIEEIIRGPALPNVVAARVLETRPHPGADRLRLVRVAAGGQPVAVVCGADNFKPGDLVALAQPGAVLADGRVIKPAVLRGEKSEGMLCAADELGLDQDHQGLLILPPDSRPGAPIAEIIGAPDDILVIEVTPNRPDCLSMLGIAREAAALYGVPLQWPALPEPPAAEPQPSDLRVEVKSQDDCPRYIARELQGIRIAPSPLWLRRRLFAAGIRPINNVVDITNYVMLECGQPLHAFDRRQLREDRIVVRRARRGEQLVTLDGDQHELSPEVLVIADAAGPVALAGIMGGEHSGVLNDTDNVVLESACFDRAGVRRATRLLGLHSESSFRFERGVDRNLSDWAARRAAALLAQLAGGRPAGLLDLHRPAAPRAPIACRYDRIRALLGIPIADVEMDAIFRALELQPAASGPGLCSVTPPSFRGDLETEADLVEEVARIHGLDRIATPAADLRRPEAERRHRRALALSRLRDILTGMDLSEIMNYSFTSEKLLGLFNGGRNQGCVPIANPLTADHGLLRHALTPQLVETLGQNRARQVHTAAVFEIGRVFFQPPQGPAAEADRLALGLMGPAGRPELDRRRPTAEEEMLLWIKGILTGLCHALKFAAPDISDKSAPHGLTLTPLASEETSMMGLYPSIFAPQRGFVINLDGRPAGVAGLLHRDLRREWRINEPLGTAEIDIDPLLAHLDAVSAPQPAPVYPAVQRDLALRVTQDITHEQITATIKRNAPRELTDVELFDIFEGGQIGEGYKSMAYCLTYRATERTLTDEEVNRMHEPVVAGLRDELRVEVRDGQA